MGLTWDYRMERMENLFRDLISAMNQQRQQAQTSAGPSTSSPIPPSSVPAPLPVEETDEEDDNITRPTGAESESDERKIPSRRTSPAPFLGLGGYCNECISPVFVKPHLSRLPILDVLVADSLR